jgi:TetR/AcrR family transcriptional repressor of nem operon
MSTTTPARGGATRENVLQHAAALFHERGYQATSIGDLLERAEIQKGSFYYWFPSKEALGHAVLDRWTEELRAKLLGPLTASDGPPALERLDKALEGFVSEQEANGFRRGCPFANLALELADVHEGFRARLATAFRELQDGFATLLSRARTEGRLRDDADPVALGHFLVAAVEGGILLAKVQKTCEPLAAAVRSARAHVLSFRT